MTVDNHADGIYIYNVIKKTDPERAEIIFELLSKNGGNRSGIAFGNVDWDGYVHPDQFTQEITFGNVKERKFGEIWTDLSHPILDKLMLQKNAI